MGSVVKKRWTGRPRVALASLAIATIAITPLALQATAVTDTEGAEATYPKVTLIAECDPVTGLYSIETTVRGDTAYPNETGTIVTTSRATTPSLVGKTVKGSSVQVGNETGVSITKKTEIVQTVAVQWTNHAKGDLVTQSGKVTVDGTCKVKPGPPTQTVTCDIIAGNYNGPLENGKHINATIATTVNGKDVELGQVNMYVDQNIAGGASYNGQTNLGLRWKILGVDQTPIPLTLDQVKSGIITLPYGPVLAAALAKMGYYSWTVTFVQTNETDTWPNFKCDTTKEDAVASVTIKTAETCYASSVPLVTLANAKQVRDGKPQDDVVLDLTVGTHTATFQSIGSSRFPGKLTEVTVTYVITAADPSLCPKDATATVSIDKEATCTTPTVLKEVLVNATADATLPTEPGTYDLFYSALKDHLFGDGTNKASILKVVILPADPSLCPEDASASFEVVKAATCTTSETVKLNLVHATATPALTQTVGTQTLTIKADKGHQLPGGKSEAILTVKVNDKKTDASCNSGGIAAGIFDDAGITNNDGLTVFGAALVAFFALIIVIGAVVLSIVFGRRFKDWRATSRAAV